jgi:cell division protein FtsB
MKTSAGFNEMVDKVRRIIRKIDEVEACKASLQREMEKLADQRAGLQNQIERLNREAGVLHARGREKMLELRKLHANYEFAECNETRTRVARARSVP